MPNRRLLSSERTHVGWRFYVKASAWEAAEPLALDLRAVPKPHRSLICATP
ncbi:hypothetical protein [Raoultibacter massiliensis]|uniref:Uncharacterized protein n=1 Tax=Raoultibacter massiliensis TaxID=1852371 RepID=A0ABV1JDP0_9ACTN